MGKSGYQPGKCGCRCPPQGCSVCADKRIPRQITLTFAGGVDATKVISGVPTITGTISLLNGSWDADLIYHNGTYIDGYDLMADGDASDILFGVYCEALYEVTIPYGTVIGGPSDEELLDTKVRLRVLVQSLTEAELGSAYPSGLTGIAVYARNPLNGMGAYPQDWYSNTLWWGSIFELGYPAEAKDWFCDCHAAGILLTEAGGYLELTPAYSDTDTVPYGAPYNVLNIAGSGDGWTIPTLTLTSKCDRIAKLPG